VGHIAENPASIAYPLGSIIAASNIFAISGAFLVIWLQDKFGHIRPLSAGIVLQSAAMLVLIFSFSPTGYALGIILFQAAWAFTWPYFLSIQADIDSLPACCPCWRSIG
jgi:MFS-type transporter involved in bile tolerance (Atg22 family)